MKNLVLALLVSLVSTSAHAGWSKIIASNDTQIEAGRIVDLVKLVDKNVKVNILVEDRGGSTDVSPTQTVYLTMYVKGEMFSTDATFEIASVFSFIEAKRIEGGIYQVKVMGFDEETYNMEEQTYLIDARNAVTEIQSVQCEDFDCDASENFKSTIKLTKK